jgi:hypothetical protein
MNRRYLLPFAALVLSLCAVAPLLAQPDSRPDHAERIRPSLDPDFDLDTKDLRPYLMTGRPVTNPYFVNRSEIVEPAASMPQNESSIAVNPLRPNVVLASAVDYRGGAWAYVSTDAGNTWRNVSLGDVRQGWPSGNDPSVAFDHLGNGYVMYGALVRGSSDPTKNGQSGIYLSKTTDDGQTWTKHLKVIEHIGAMTLDSVLEDKYYIEIDRSTASPYLGRLYTPWKRVTDRDSATQIMFAHSTDGGLTWSAPVAVSPRKPRTSLDTTFGQSFPLAAAGPDGTLYVVWHDGPMRAIGFARSSDGGATFTAARYPITGNPPHGSAKASGNEVYHVLKNTFRAETYPTMAVDNSSSPRSGWIYLAWAAGVSPNVYFVRSSDRGETWSSPAIIHSDTTNDQWWPWLSVDRTTGDIAVMYSDSRDDPQNILVDQYVSYSSDGGATWHDRRATDAMSDFRANPFAQGVFAGDYSGNAFHAGRIYPSFLDTRTDEGRKDNDVYVSLINIHQPLPVDSLRAVIDPLALTSLDLEWRLPETMTEVFDKPLVDYAILVDRDSVRIAELAPGTTTLPDTGLVHGQLYTYRVRVASATDTSIARTVAVRAGGALEPMAPVFISATAASNDSVAITFRVPSVRADGSVPLANLDAINIYRDGGFRRQIPLFTSDTGRTITINDAVPQRGYYRYWLTAIDKAEPQNESAPSDTIVAYAGGLEPYAESFDGTMPRFLISGEWATTSRVALSPPSSLTDSPQGDYAPRGNSSVQLFPVRLDGGLPLLTFSHMAIVDPTDSAIVEARYDGDSTWTTIRSYNWSASPAWSDSVANPGDWASERIDVSRGTADTIVTVRFRLKTNIFRNGDGWYIDDIVWDRSNGVELASETSLAASVRPNPFASAAIIEYSLADDASVTIRLLDLLGREVRRVDLGEVARGRHAWTLDASELPMGSYLYEVRAGAARAAGRLVRQP